MPVGAPPAAGFAGAYVADALGGGRSTQLVTAGVLIVLVAAMNYRGIRVSATVQLVVAAVLAGLLALATVAALPHADLDRLTPFAPCGWAAVGTAAALLVWAFAGWEVVTSLSAEYRDPARDIPRATAIAVGVIGRALPRHRVHDGDGARCRPRRRAALGPARARPGRVGTAGHDGRRRAALGGRDERLLRRDRPARRGPGAATARCPAWLAQGSAPGAVPRRALLVVTAGSLTTLAVIGVVGARLESTLLVVTGAFTLVYVVGTAAALRLLPRGGAAWRCAAVSFVATLALLVLTGRHILVTLGIAAGALGWALLGRAAAPASTRGQRPSAAPADGCPA